MRPGRSQSFYAGPRAAFEKKFIDTNQQMIMMAGGEIQGNFFNCAQGNTPRQRIGNKITVTNINIRGLITSGSNNADANTANECPTFRVIIGIDKQANGALPSIFSAASTETGILQGPNGNPPPGGAPVGYAAPLAFRNMYNLERFVILKDKLISTRCASIGTTGASRIDTAVPFKFSWKGMLPVLYAANSPPLGDVADIRSNNLFVALIPDRVPAGAASSANGTFELTCRVKFIDA